MPPSVWQKKSSKKKASCLTQEKCCPAYGESILNHDTEAACYTASNFSEKQIQNDFNENPTRSGQGSFFSAMPEKLTEKRCGFLTG